MSRIRKVQRLGAGVAVAVMALALPASAAELVAAELEGTVNEVTVEQGKSQNFNISLSATGSVACDSTHTAEVHQSYMVSDAGAVSSQTLSAAVNFSSGTRNGNSANCDITPTTPQTVAAAVSAGATTPVGTYTVSLSESNGNTKTWSSNNNSGTAKLDDKDATTLNIKVVAPTSIVDTTPPTVAVTGFTPGQVFVYAVDALPIVGCDTQDAGSGVRTPASVSSRGGPLGTVTVTCSGAEDNAGNVAAPVSQSYHVRYGHSGGIGQPINPDGSSLFSQKRAVPVKFALQGDEPSGFAVTGFKLLRTPVPCQGGVVTENEAEAQPVTTSTSWRYDSVDDQYIFNASLAGTTVGNCYQYQVDLGDGGPRVLSATFKVTK